MIIDRIVLRNFRNYEMLDLAPAPGINCITGRNGCGKTNIIEAIALLSQVRSFRGVADAALMRWGADSYFCRADVVDNDERRFEIGCAAVDGRVRRRFKIDETIVKGAAEYYGRFVAVIFSPDDLGLVDGTPEARRRYFDTVIAKTDRGYLRDLIDIRKVLAARNRILRDLRSGVSSGHGHLGIWDAMFAELAAKIVERRRVFMESFNPVFRGSCAEVSDDDLEPSLVYEPSTGNRDKQGIIDALAADIARDLQRGSTGIGPQRDDFRFVDGNGRNISDVASQGQKRTVVIALKNAEIDSVESTLGKRAVLLIDDIFAELDHERRQKALALFRRQNQVFVTMVSADREWTSEEGGRFFQVEDGNVRIQ